MTGGSKALCSQEARLPSVHGEPLRGSGYTGNPSPRSSFLEVNSWQILKPTGKETSRLGYDVTLSHPLLGWHHGVRTLSLHQDTASLHAGNTAAAWQSRWRANTGLGWASAQDSGHNLPPPPSSIRINNGIYVGAQEEQASLRVPLTVHFFISEQSNTAPSLPKGFLYSNFPEQSISDLNSSYLCLT